MHVGNLSEPRELLAQRLYVDIVGPNADIQTIFHGSPRTKFEQKRSPSGEGVVAGNDVGAA